MFQHGTPVYHVEKRCPFISLLSLYGHVMGFFTGILRDFSNVHGGGGGGANGHSTPALDPWIHC